MQRQSCKKKKKNVKKSASGRTKPPRSRKILEEGWSRGREPGRPLPQYLCPRSPSLSPRYHRLVIRDKRANSPARPWRPINPRQKGLRIAWPSTGPPKTYLRPYRLERVPLPPSPGGRGECLHPSSVERPNPGWRVGTVVAI